MSEDGLNHNYICVHCGYRATTNIEFIIGGNILTGKLEHETSWLCVSCNKMNIRVDEITPKIINDAFEAISEMVFKQMAINTELRTMLRDVIKQIDGALTDDPEEQRVLRNIREDIEAALAKSWKGYKRGAP